MRFSTSLYYQNPGYIPALSIQIQRSVCIFMFFSNSMYKSGNAGKLPAKPKYIEIVKQLCFYRCSMFV